MATTDHRQGGLMPSLPRCQDLAEMPPANTARTLTWKEPEPGGGETGGGLTAFRLGSRRSHHPARPPAAGSQEGGCRSVRRGSEVPGARQGHGP